MGNDRDVGGGIGVTGVLVRRGNATGDNSDGCEKSGFDENNGNGT
jgi:hypothetical protein